MDNLFALNMTFLRRHHRLGQDEVAKELGVTRPTVSNYERGESFPDYEKLLYFSKKYRVNLDDLLKKNLSKGYEPTDDLPHNTETLATPAFTRHQSKTVLTIVLTFDLNTYSLAAF